jgi:biopolymer transport protein ExbB
MNLLEILGKGGWVIILIGISSLIGLGIFIERMIVLKKAKMNFNTFLMKLTHLLSKKEIKEALLLCSETPGPIPRVLEKGIRMIGRSREDIKEALETAGRAEIYQLEKGIGVLGTIAGVAPLLGFLGTVTGMIQAFMKIEELGGNVNATVLAGGIWEALITTAAGLAVGIPAMIAYNYLVGKVKRFVYEIEQSSQELLETLTTMEEEKTV